MGDGYAGKILKIDLTAREVEEIDTEPYKQWGGGHGIGSALFWDYCKDKTVSAFDPGNVVTVMTSPLTGTLVPSSARTEVQGIGAQPHPTEWFTRSNFGGRFGGMLKMAGWDGLVLLGAADSPVWIDIRDDKVEIRDASETGDGLWGLDTFETQEKIWGLVGSDGDWLSGDARDSGRTTQRAAILATGPAGENLSRIGALIHDGGSGAGQGGFGGVWGSKNLKAVSVIGTGSIAVADPNALMDTRMWVKDTYGFDPENPVNPGPAPFALTFGGQPSGGTRGTDPGEPTRPEGCMSCHRSCHGIRATNGLMPGSSCYDMWYGAFEIQMHEVATAAITGRATDLMQRLGLNSCQVELMTLWLAKIAQKGVVGPGLAVDTDIFKHTLGGWEWAEQYLTMIAYREGLGDLLTEGGARAAEALGRLDEDVATGDLALQEWGYSHHYDGRTEAEWGYGSILGSRDINEHDFNWICYWTVTMYSLYGMEMPLSAKELAEMIGSKLLPYGDPMMVNYSDEGIYSESMVKLVSWHRAYGNYYKESLGLCDWGYADFYNPQVEGYSGLTPVAEPRYVRDVIGLDESFEEGIAKGTRIWNLDRAIWALQGRHRDQEVYGEYMYSTPAMPGFTMFEAPYTMPVFENGEWSYKSVAGRVLDRGRVEEWKTAYYEFEGWDPATGWPRRDTLEGMDLGFVADELDAAGKLGG